MSDDDVTISLSDDEMGILGAFTCECCKGSFTKGWTDEEAAAEAAAHGFLEDGADNVLVCDECFMAIMGHNDHPIGEYRPPGAQS